MRLKNKKAIVTGASRNIGAAIALKLAQEGADVLLHYNSDEAGARDVQVQIEKLGRRAAVLQCDFGSQESITQFIQAAIAFLGGIDILINNAAGYDSSNFLELEPRTLKSLLAIGVVAPMQLMQVAAKVMIKDKISGVIVNISSISGLRPYASRSAHATAKAALNMLTQNAAIDLGPSGIRVNAICPGAVPYGDPSDFVTDAIPLGRAGKPEDIANAAAFLASDDAAWMTGHIMVVDGGQSLSMG